MRPLVKTKGEFVKRVREMSSPSLKKIGDPCQELLNAQWLIEDMDSYSNSFLVPGVRLLQREYYGKSLDDYELRYEKTKAKYERWFSDAQARGLIQWRGYSRKGYRCVRVKFTEVKG